MLDLGKFDHGYVLYINTLVYIHTVKVKVQVFFEAGQQLIIGHFRFQGEIRLSIGNSEEPFASR